MSPFLKILYILAWVLQQAFTWLIVVPILIIVFLIVYILTLPYTLFYFSSNFSLLTKDFPPVELYLRHFERLHPDLITYVALAHTAAARRQGQPPGINHWPRQRSSESLYLVLVTYTRTEWTFSQAAGLFARLEAANWDRRLLWTFLRDQVEQAGLVTQEEKEAYAKVMEKMNSHRLQTGIDQVVRKIAGLCDRGGDSDGQAQQQQEEVQADLYAHLNLPIEHVQEDSLDWILHRGALLVPNRKTWVKMVSLAEFTPVWGKIRKGRDLEKGFGDRWQIIDVRKKRPWEGK